MEAPGYANDRKEVVIRPVLPSGSASLRGFGAQAWFGAGAGLLLVAGVAAVRADFSPFSLTLVGLGIWFVALFVFVRLTFRNVTLYVRHGFFGRTNFLGKKTEWPLDEVRVMRMLSVPISQMGVSGVPKLVFLSRDGRSVTQMSAAGAFRTEDLRRLAAAGDMEIRGSWEDIVTAADLEAQYPGSYSALSLSFLVPSRHSDWRLPAAAAIVLVSIMVIAILELAGRH